MRLSEKQAQMLFLIACESLSLLGSLGYDRATRQVLVDDIVEQQSNELKELDKGANHD